MIRCKIFNYLEEIKTNNNNNRHFNDLAKISWLTSAVNRDT